jgi:hypothetical protein
MPQGTPRIHSVAETDLQDAVTRGGFLLSYSALMGVVVSTTTPFVSNDWSSVWLFTLAAAAVAALLVVGGLFVWPKAIASASEHRVTGFTKNPCDQ